MSEDDGEAATVGEGAMIFGVGQIVPHLNRNGWKTVQLSDDQWRKLEVALEKSLDASLREKTCEAISYFIHSLRLKKKIATPRQYAKALRARIAEIADMANNLLAGVMPLMPQTDIDAITAKEARRLIGGRDVTWNFAASAARTTEDDDEVWAVEDHIRMLVATRFPNDASATQTALLGLLRSLHAMEQGIADIPHNKAGPDGNYELSLLLVDLLRVAHASGDNLDLAGHDIRDSVMGELVKPKPAYRFVERAIELILASAAELVAELNLGDEDQNELLELISNNLDRKSGTFIEPMEAARKLVMSRPRE